MRNSLLYNEMKNAAGANSFGIDRETFSNILSNNMAMEK